MKLPEKDFTIQSAYWTPIANIYRFIIPVDEEHLLVVEIQKERDGGYRTNESGLYRENKLIQRMNGEEWPLERLLENTKKDPDAVAEEAMRVAIEAVRIHPKYDAWDENE